MIGRKTVTPDKRKSFSTKKDVVFANVVQKRRIELGLTQTDIAKRMGLPPQRVSEIESGTFPASREKIVSLADALDVDLNWLFGREWPKTKGR